ncbi:MAG: ABC-type transport auxiliary lipoprotein family protein [Coxiellaceae bacterium]|nr:ABC-type transport auxiliary lipoprotein family protein [Coxiellaceae bacterium]
MLFLRNFLLVVFLTLLLSGCGLKPLPVKPSMQYTFTTWPKTSAFPEKAATNKTLLVSMPIAAPGYQSSKMIYVTVPYELKAFADHRWVAPPADLLLPLLSNRLRTVGYFKAVVTAPFAGSTNYQLNTELLTLQQEFMRPESSVRMAVEVTLVRTDTGAVVANRVFEVTVPANSNDPYGGVLAANTATHRLLDKIALFVVKHAR